MALKISERKLSRIFNFGYHGRGRQKVLDIDNKVDLATRNVLSDRHDLFKYGQDISISSKSNDKDDEA